MKQVSKSAVEIYGKVTVVTDEDIEDLKDKHIPFELLGRICWEDCMCDLGLGGICPATPMRSADGEHIHVLIPSDNPRSIMYRASKNSLNT